MQITKEFIHHELERDFSIEQISRLYDLIRANASDEWEHISLTDTLFLVTGLIQVTREQGE